MDIKQILILVGFAVYYFIKNSNKKEKDQTNPNARKPQQAAGSQRSIESILRDLSEKSIPVKEAPKASVEPVSPSYSEATENKPRRPHRKKTIPESIQIETLDDDVHFDLRQAIINDAILNRPHQ
ncbi:MAG: hypothetical protein ACI9JN_000049 [Bacteroidia bacterium]|jgi:hypothetical protein